MADGWPGIFGWVFVCAVLIGVTAAMLWRFAVQPCSLWEVFVIGAFGSTLAARPTGVFWILLSGAVIAADWWGTLVALSQLDTSSVQFRQWWSSHEGARVGAVRYGLSVIRNGFVIIWSAILHGVVALLHFTFGD